jgi:hypothetical protein
MTENKKKHHMPREDLTLLKKVFSYLIDWLVFNVNVSSISAILWDEEEQYKYNIY